MELLFNVIFAWASVILVFLLSIIWILRIGLKKKWFSPKSFLGKMNRTLRIHHKTIGIAFVMTAVVHGFYSSTNVLSVNYGTACIVAGLLLGLMLMVKKRVDRKKWLMAHRVLTICVIGLLVLHLIDVGGAPATSVLLSQIGINGAESGERLESIEAELEASEEELKKMQEAQGIVYQDGVYTGVAMGYGPDLTVDVTVQNGLIAKIEIVEHNEVGERFYEPAMETVPQAIIDEQSVTVDSVSGATFTSVGIKNAVLEALKQAVVEGELPEVEAEELPQQGKGHHHGNHH